jgi:hypothetical protein
MNKENNKLIAEFLIGNQPVSFIGDDGAYDLFGVTELNDIFSDIPSDCPDAKHFFLPSEMEFHSSWDWLMPVVKKLSDTEEEDGESFSMDAIMAEQSLMLGLSTGDINIAFDGVIKSIECYNKK